MPLDVFLLILRILLIVLLYLFLLQVVFAIWRDLRKSVPAPVSNSPQVLAHLVVINSGPSHISPGTSFGLQPKTTIGRGPTNTIQIPESFISGEHARIWFQDGTWYVQDAGSKNGTWVNDQPALQALQARPGDVLKLGFIYLELAQ